MILDLSEDQEKEREKKPVEPEQKPVEKDDAEHSR
jgi:hypothetical protein